MFRKFQKNSLQRLSYLLRQNYLQVESLIPLVGKYGVPLFLFYYVLWKYIFPQPYENLSLRVIASVLCLGLATSNYWNTRFQKILPYYWLLTFFYCIPFLFSYFFFKNDATPISALGVLGAIFLTIFLIGWYTNVILLLGGFLSAWSLYLFFSANPTFSFNEYLPIFAFYGSILALGMMISYQATRFQARKLKSIAETTGVVAHELRTPLLGIRSGALGLRRYLPVLYAGYEMAREKGLPVPFIRPIHYQNLIPTLERMEKETYYANTIIDMLLTNVRTVFESRSFEICSIQEGIDEALARYPFQTAEEQEKIVVLPQRDFHFYGSKLLIVHVLFNLIKNALYFIAKAGKGEITLWTSTGEKHNELHFKDTAEGIPAHILSRLFERFFTTTQVGTGLGLSFCYVVMESLNGKIRCFSEEGRFTEFVLYFPKINNKISNCKTSS